MSMARLGTIEHSHRPAAATATDQSGQQGATATCRLPLGPALHMSVLRDQLLVRLVLFPADVAGVMIAQQDGPSGHRLRMAGGLAGATVDDASALGCAAEDIGAGIDRMPEDLQYRVVGRRPPLDLAHAAVVAPGNRQLQRLILRPKQDLPSTPELLEFVEQKPDDSADALVRVYLDLPDLVPAIAGWEDEPQLAPQCLRIPRWRSRLSSYSDIVPFS